MLVVGNILKWFVIWKGEGCLVCFNEMFMESDGCEILDGNCVNLRKGFGDGGFWNFVYCM